MRIIYACHWISLWLSRLLVLFIFTSGLFLKLSPLSASGVGMLLSTPNNTFPFRVTYFLYTSSYRFFFFYFYESFLSHLIYTHTNACFPPTTHKSSYVGHKQRAQSTREASPTVGGEAGLHHELSCDTLM